MNRNIQKEWIAGGVTLASFQCSTIPPFHHVAFAENVKEALRFGI